MVTCVGKLLNDLGGYELIKFFTEVSKCFGRQKISYQFLKLSNHIKIEAQTF